MLKKLKVETIPFDSEVSGFGIKIIFRDGEKITVRNPYSKEEKTFVGPGTTVFYSFIHKTIGVTPKAYAPFDPDNGNWARKTDQNFAPIFIIPEKISCSVANFGRVHGKRFARRVANIILSHLKK